MASRRFQAAARGEPVAPLSSSQRCSSGSVVAPIESAETAANTACKSPLSFGFVANVGQTPMSIAPGAPPSLTCAPPLPSPPAPAKEPVPPPGSPPEPASPSATLGGAVAPSTRVHDEKTPPRQTRKTAKYLSSTGLRIASNSVGPKDCDF